MTDVADEPLAPPELIDGLADWLAPHLGAPVTVVPRGKPGSGFSAENLVVSATGSSRSGDFVLRLEPTEVTPYAEQAPGLGTGVVVQHRVNRALAGRVPVAVMVGLETDPRVLGRPFFVMEFVAGVVPIENPPCTVEGFYADAPAALRTAMHDHGLRAMAAIHATPWRDTDLTCLDPVGTTPGGERQLDLTEAKLLDGLAGRTAAIFDDAIGYLRAAQPPTPAPEDVVLLWGDARLGNVIWDGETGEVRCVTDFEAAAVGERALDVGWWLMADRWMHEHSGVDRLPGEPTRPEQVASYAAAAGRPVVAEGVDLRWYEALASYRFAVTVVHTMRRWEDAGLLPADHTIWRDNPATEILRAVLDEVATS